MSKFSELAKKIEKQFTNIQNNDKLFRSSISGDDLWEAYINSFKKEDNPVFRDPNSSVNNCNLDKSFIRRYGNVVSIDSSYNVVTMWDIDLEESSAYYNSCKRMSELLKNAPIKDVFFETFDELNSLPYEKIKNNQEFYKLGFESNYKTYTKEEADKFGVVTEGKVYQFFHFYGILNKKFVDTSGKSQASIISEFRDSKNIFMRGLEEISIDTLHLVKDLVNQGSLLDGQTHLYKVEQMIPFKKEYDDLSRNKKENWCWLTSYRLPFSKFRNELIGTLCVELTEGVDINVACQTWNKRVDPANYMKATAPITKKQIEDAKKFVEENGYVESFNRRLAVIDDIKVSEILHSNIGDGKSKTVSIFDNIKSTSTRHKRSEFDGVEEVGIEKFMEDILPNCTSVEAYLQNNHDGNMVTMTTSNVKESKPIFKWDNNYSWTFNGNLAGKSQIKDAIKSRGGNVEGVLNIRLAFPNTTDDYDLHVKEPNGGHIYYSSVRRRHSSSGMLDLDAQGVDGHQSPEKRVENIIYTDLNSMPSGIYKVYVHNYSNRGFKNNFTLEVEIDGEVTTVELDKLGSYNTADVFEITLKNGKFDVKLEKNIKLINSNSISKEIYGLETNKFHKVNLISLSPNHWGENNIGNKHYFFMLEGCKTNNSIRGFHVENLIPELLAHKKVIEVLGNTSMIESSDKQLSGLGFNATVKDELILKLHGSFKRIIKVKF